MENEQDDVVQCLVEKGVREDIPVGEILRLGDRFELERIKGSSGNVMSSSNLEVNVGKLELASTAPHRSRNCRAFVSNECVPSIGGQSRIDVCYVALMR